jgi:predicted GNAT superfamily acetyltransferase
VKLRQRAWALAHEHDTMVWTFDPLVGRNARFNLAKLGTEAPEYDIAFYGRMSDEINGEDDSDRLVARWRLASRRTVAATEGTAADPAGPVEGTEGAEVLREGPDGAPMAVRDARGLWCRVPRDIVALRRDRPQEATRWRLAVRETLTGALDEGLVATHMSRDGWYLLTPEEVVS